MGKIFISLSTLPNRIKYIRKTLNSLQKQVQSYDKIMLWLPERGWKNNEPFSWKLPNFLKKYSKLEINHCRDYGPLTKLAPALLKDEIDSDDKIVTIDDDIIYPSTWLEDLTEHSENYPECVVGLRGGIVTEELEYLKMKDFGDITQEKIMEPVEVDMLTGVYGVLYKKRFFDIDDLLNMEENEHSFRNDDLWISGHLAKKHITKLCVPYRGYVKDVKGFRGVTKLWHINSVEDHNNSLIRYFKDYWLYSKKDKSDG